MGALSSIALVAVCAVLAAACGDAANEVASLPLPPQAEQSDLFIEEVPISHEDLVAPEQPAAPSEPAPATASARAARKQPAASARAEAPLPPAPVPVPLESLLRTPLAPGPPNALDPKVLREPPVAAAPSPSRGALGSWKERVHIERRTEATGPSGPRQGNVSQTDAGLRIPVDESVSVEGGVRVDSREEAGTEKSERSSMPRVGVEVKF